MVVQATTDPPMQIAPRLLCPFLRRNLAHQALEFAKATAVVR
jgi:hypothetical protein